MKASETADYSVCTVWLFRGEAHYLLDLMRERLEFPDLKRRAIALHARWRPMATLVEDKGSGTSLLQELRTLGVPAIPFQPSGDKMFRMHAQSVRFETGSVYVPRAASWLHGLIAELLAFPVGRHDDQVDSVSQALEYGPPSIEHAPSRASGVCDGPDAGRSRVPYEPIPTGRPDGSRRCTRWLATGCTQRFAPVASKWRWKRTFCFAPIPAIQKTLVPAGKRTPIGVS